MKLIKNICFLFLFFILLNTHQAFAFSLDADTASIYQCFRFAKQAETPDSIAFWYQEGLKVAASMECTSCFLDGSIELSEYYITQNQLAAAERVLAKGLARIKQEGTPIQEAKIYNQLAILKFYQGAIKEAEDYFYKVLDCYKKEGTQEQLANTYSNLANIFQTTGNWIKSVELYIEALKIYEAIGLSDGIGTTLYNIGVLYYDNDRDSLAASYFLEAEQILKKEGKSLFWAQVATSLAEHYFDEERWVDAETLIKDALAIFEKEAFPFGIAQASDRLGSLYIRLNKIDAATTCLLRSKAIADTLGFEQQKAWTGLNLAKVEMAKGNYQNALHYANQSLTIFEELQMKRFIPFAYWAISRAYEAEEKYEQALASHQTYTEKKDSFITERMNQQISELQIAYDTEKKDKEITTLKQAAKLSSLRNIFIITSLIAALLIAILFFNQQRLRHQKNQQLLIQGKRLEEEKFKTAKLENEKLQRELDFKKQELSSQVLSLCRRNETLQDIKEQLKSLKNSDRNANQAIQKLADKIARELTYDEDWDAFLETFKSVHTQYFDKLNSEFPNLTAGEIRLASLLKLNLSAKEIATLLNISPNGIKKARYRLRKKLGLNSEVNIQEFLIRYPESAVTP